MCVAFRCDFSEVDGCLVKARYNDRDCWLVWREGTESAGGYHFEVSGLTLDGQGRAGAGLYAACANDWVISDVYGTGCRHGVLVQSQCYSGRVTGLHATGNHCGLSLCNNTGIVTVSDCHLGEGNGVGLIAADSDALVIVNGWMANNSVANMIVKGDQSSVTCVGGGFGFEGGGGASNVRLHNLSSASFTGTSLLPLTEPIPAVEMTHCSAGRFEQVRFGLHPDCAGAVLTTSHDGTRPVQITEGRRWGSGSAPAIDPASS
jgi:hypothetical protein